MRIMEKLLHTHLQTGPKSQKLLYVVIINLEQKIMGNKAIPGLADLTKENIPTTLSITHPDDVESILEAIVEESTDFLPHQLLELWLTPIEVGLYMRQNWRSSVNIFNFTNLLKQNV